MDITDSPNYDDAVSRLRKDPVVIAMAHDMRRADPEDLGVTVDGENLSTAYMSAANEEYTRRGGKFEGPKPIGAVARAVLSLVATSGLTPEELYEDWSDAFLQTTIERAARRMKRDPNPTVAELHAELLAEQERRRTAAT